MKRLITCIILMSSIAYAQLPGLPSTPASQVSTVTNNFHLMSSNNVQSNLEELDKIVKDIQEGQVNMAADKVSYEPHRIELVGMTNVQIALDAVADKAWYVEPFVAFVVGDKIIYEDGSTVSSVDLSFEASKWMDSRIITNTAGYSLDLGAGQNYTGTHSGIALIEDTTYFVTVSDNLGLTVTNHLKIDFDNRLYAGALTTSNLTSSNIKTLQYARWYQENETFQGPITISNTPPNQFVFFCYPVEGSKTDLTFTVNGFVNDGFLHSIQTFTNLQNKAVEYNVWMLEDAQSSTVNLAVESFSRELEDNYLQIQINEVNARLDQEILDRIAGDEDVSRILEVVDQKIDDLKVQIASPVVLTVSGDVIVGNNYQYVVSRTPASQDSFEVWLNGVMMNRTYDFDVDVGTKTLTWLTHEELDSEDTVLLKYLAW